MRVAGDISAAFQPIDSRSLSAAATYTATVQGGLYREIRIALRGAGGMTSAGGPAKIQFNGDTTNNYWSATFYRANSSTGVSYPGTAGGDTSGQLAITGGAPATDFAATITIFPQVVSGVGRQFFCDFTTKGAADAAHVGGESSGFWKDTTTVMTTILITFGANFTGEVITTGVQS